ncbi:MAG TPA: phytanoyl-CoA dioxygenase family protein [Abditibacteriaceae bacterium]|jgi:ectoine hydroxylase-related dioxygenase (phytanoyl-CoA dioxygenase family)
MLSPLQLEQFHQNGFVKGSRVLNDAEIEMLQRETLRVIDERETLAQAPVGQKPVLLHDMGRAGTPLWQIVDIWMASAPFKTLVSSEIIAQEVQQLTGARELRLFHDQIQYKPAAANGKSGGANLWHQDSPYWPILQPKDSEITAWVALDDVDEENGCMWMIPGSHKWGDAISDIHEHLGEAEDFFDLPSEHNGHEVRAVACPVQRGEVHYHHALTWHGSNVNASSRPRRAIALHYMNENTVFDDSGQHPMKSFISTPVGEPVRGDAFPQVWPR